MPCKICMQLAETPTYTSTFPSSERTLYTPTVLAACCGFDLRHTYILYLYWNLRKFPASYLSIWKSNQVKSVYCRMGPASLERPRLRPGHARPPLQIYQNLFHPEMDFPILCCVCVWGWGALACFSICYWCPQLLGPEYAFAG